LAITDLALARNSSKWQIHLGQRPSAPHKPAGQMTATAENHSRCHTLPDGRRPHKDPGLRRDDDGGIANFLRTMNSFTRVAQTLANP
jgi:hypothetical protein